MSRLLTQRSENVSAVLNEVEVPRLARHGLRLQDLRALPQRLPDRRGMCEMKQFSNVEDKSFSLRVDLEDRPARSSAEATLLCIRFGNSDNRGGRFSDLGLRTVSRRVFFAEPKRDF